MKTAVRYFRCFASREPGNRSVIRELFLRREMGNQKNCTARARSPTTVHGTLSQSQDTGQHAGEDRLTVCEGADKARERVCDPDQN